MSDAYLDIETTGLSCGSADITIIGIYLVNSRRRKMVQLVGKEVTPQSLLEVLDGVETIYTYNGSRFDLPFIAGALGVDLTGLFHHHDLMYDCWRCNLRGGFKAVERHLGIARETVGITGWDAVVLWRQYAKYGDAKALATLLKYNEEDTMNLKLLKERLSEL